MKYYEKLSGENIYLSPIDSEDYELFCKWYNTKSIAECSGMIAKLVGKNAQKQSLEYMSKNDFNFSVIERKDNCLIGFGSIFDIRREDRSAEIGIMIGEEEKQNKGYGKEIGHLLIEYCFDVLNLNSIYAKIASFNQRSISLCKKLGFIESGKRRQAWYNDGKYYDEIIVDMLRDEYYECKGK